MKNQLYTIIDVETTGNGILGNRITEICIVVLCGEEIIDKFTSLVNPEQSIPPFITGLTGIDNDMVRDAPKFAEIADRILTMTKEAVFVAHNVNFDYNVIKSEFRMIGHTFSRKKLCTVRLSRKLIPGLFSYSLGRLCSSLDIPLVDRHRAEGDTDATVQLFRHILSLDKDKTVINSFLNARSKEATLPPHIDVTQVDTLPEATGIYLFKDKKGQIIYVGKAKNIKKRVLSHFYDKKNKEYVLGQQTHTIDYEITGNELIALLLEAEKIQQYYPQYNTAQKKMVTPYRIIQYVNRKGIIQLAIDRSKDYQYALDVFYTKSDAMARLEALCIAYKLCPKYCNLQHTLTTCSHYKIKSCNKICEGKESVALYNIRVQQALSELQNQQKTYCIKEKGKTEEEESFIMVENGLYKGFGYVNNTTEQLLDYSDFEPFLIPQKHTYHTSKIINSYLHKNTKNNITYLEERG